MPCGKISIPAPKLFTSLPLESNFSTVGSSDILPVARVEAAVLPQRSATQIDLPSLSTSTALGRLPRACFRQLGQPSMR